MGFIETKTSNKGQVTVPLEVRNQIGLLPGGILRFRTLEDGTVVIAAKKKGSKGLQGIFSKPPKPIDVDRAITETLMEKHFPKKSTAKHESNK
jgi:antitoxin PrlF